MDETYPSDAIAYEKPDPVEGTSARFLMVPPMLLSFLLGFGLTYLYFQTDNFDFRQGDRRSPVKTSAEKVAVTESNPLEIGGQIYKKRCQACHQAKGQGLKGAFPPLDGSDWVTGSPERTTAIVLHGISGEITVNGEPYKGVMPGFDSQLTPEEVAAVVSYVRGSWSNTADPVSPELVKKVQADTSDRSKPWGGEKELEAQTWE